MHPHSQETDLTYSIKSTSYFFSETTKKLFPESTFKKNQFCEYGSDLAICLNGIRNTSSVIELLSSIEYYLPDFKGHIIITTDNKNTGHKQIIEEYIITSTASVEMIDVDEKLTVADIRNYTANKLDKNWLLFLEPGMYFIKNPLIAIKNTIEELGVNFLNFPLLNSDNKTIFSLGGALLIDIDKNNRFISGGSCFDFKPGTEFNDVQIEKPFLSDYLFGNACIVNRKAFLEEGGFSNNVTPGLEDVEFSLRLYNKSIKIGNANEFVLISNHKVADDSNTITGEVKKADNKSKDGNSIADAKVNEITYTRNVGKRFKEKRGRKRIALIVDIKEWAFHNIAKNIETNLSEKYDFKIYFQADYMGEKWLDLFSVLFHERFDMIMCFWRPLYKHLFSVENRDHLKYKFGIGEEEYAQFLNETILLTGVYDHLFLKPFDIKKHLDVFSNHVDGYFVSSHKLKDIYDTIEGYDKPYTVIQDGVDLEKFYRKADASFSSPSSPLVVGWAGNSKWGMADDGIDHKGFETIIKPAIEELVEEGYSIQLIYADRQEPNTHIPRSQMNDFYNKLDVYICASDIEGTPNPVLESMACGIGIISTDVGIVKEVFGKEQHKFILELRTKDCLKQKLITLINDRNILQTLAKENHIRINTWTWKSKCEKFEQFFEYYFYKKSTNSLRLKKFPYSTTVIAPKEVTHTVILNEKEGAGAHVLDNVQVQMVDTRSKEELAFWQQNFTDTKNWYYKEYEVLPLWFKRFGHIIKVFQGHRTFKSLFSNNVNHK